MWVTTFHPGTGQHQKPNRPERSSGPVISPEEKKKLKQTMEDLFGTRGACIFDQNLNILGKVPISELNTTIKSLKGGIYALTLDGTVDLELLKLSERLGIKFLIGTSSKVRDSGKVKVLTESQL